MPLPSHPIILQASPSFIYRNSSHLHHLKIYMFQKALILLHCFPNPMATPDDFSADESSNYYTPSSDCNNNNNNNNNVCDSFRSRTGSSSNHLDSSDIWADPFWGCQDSFGELWKDFLLFNDPTAATMSLSSLSTNNEPYGPGYNNMHEQLGSIDQCMINIPEKGRSAAGPEPALGAGELVEFDLSEQQPVVEGDALSRGRDIGSSSQSLLAITVAEKKNKRKLSLEKRKTTHQTIGVEDLEQHFGKTRKEAAKSLDVSVPTLKRVSRKHGISRWPFNKKNKVLNMSVKDDEGTFGQTSLTTSSGSGVQPEKGNESAAYLVQPETEIDQIPDSGETAPPWSDTTPPKQLATETTVVQISPPETAKQDKRRMTVKVKYRDDFVKFEISSMSTMVNLEEEIAKRLKLKVGSFDIKYFDEDGDWVLITCDVDLCYCMRSVGRTTIKMLVLPIS